MKKLLFILTTIAIFSSCATTNETRSSRVEQKNEKKIAKQVMVRNSVENRRFIIKFDRLYFAHGGIVELRPKSNYLIVDGSKAIISTAYIGRQYDIRPIAGINVRGETLDYNMESDSIKGNYKIKMNVNNGNNSFKVYLTIGKNGSCSVTMTNVKIDMVRYSGDIVPIRVKNEQPDGKDIMI